MEFKGYSSLWKAVIRPPRLEYAISDLGPEVFELNHVVYKRTDVILNNKFGFKIHCSHFEPEETYRSWEEMPCVVYMHGNSSSRLEALEALPYILPANITLFCFDFAGCGISEGEYISLGWHERDDLNIIVEYLRNERKVSTIGLWGRSMGSVTALLHGDRDPSIAGMVLDSPFSNMKILVNELAKQYTKIPSFLVSGALKIVKSTVKSKAKFDLDDLSPIDHVSECFIPAMFACANGDDFIQPHHTQDLFNKYAGDKNIVRFEGDHNSMRPEFFFNSVVIFFHNTLQVESLLREDNKISSSKKKSSNDFEGDDDYLGGSGQNMLFQSIGRSSNMGANPFGQSMGDAHFSNHDEDNEEEILRKIMEESMRTHQEEESKRTGSISNSNQQIQQQPDFFDFNANSEISSLQDNSNSNQHPQIGSNVYPQIGNNPYPQIGDYGQTQLRFGMAPGQSEEDYLLECMSNVQISQQNNQPNANIINNNQPNNGNNNKPSQQSIDDLLNM